MWYDSAKKDKKIAHFLLSKETYLTFEVQRCVSGGFFPNVLDEKRRVWNPKSDVEYTFLKIVKITIFHTSTLMSKTISDILNGQASLECMQVIK
jgi:hypothetical protein